MGLSRIHLISLLWAVVVQENCLHTVNCQEEDNSRCLPRKTFIALLRLPEVGSNLAAYSRTARIIQDSKDRTDYANLKSHGSNDDGGEDATICLPPGVYLELFNDPATRGHLATIGRVQRVFEEPLDRLDDTRDLVAEDIIDSEKRSLATLAKNGDLPISIQDRSQNNPQNGDTSSQTARFDSLSSESLDGLMKILADGGVEDRHNIPEIAAEYTLPNGELDLEALARDFPPTGKRNVAALARDFALPSQSSSISNNGKRNVGALARDWGLPNGKRNVGTLARDRMLPQTNGKRNIASLRGGYILPSYYLNGNKRNIGSVASTINQLRYGKRYIGALARSADWPIRDYYEKRNIAALARNGDFYGKRNVGTLARDWSLPNQNRHGRSLTVKELNAERLDRQLQKLGGKQEAKPRIQTTTGKASRSNNFEDELTNVKSDAMIGNRSKRQIDYTDEYPLPVMQNTEVSDYEDLIERLTGEYPNTEKRFMGARTELQDRGDTTAGEINLYQPSKRHIGTLARHGWLPSIKAARFSRSPRYLVNRQDPADGTSADNTADTSTWTLRDYRRPTTRYQQSLQRDCRHSFRTNPPLPAIGNVLGRKF